MTISGGKTSFYLHDGHGSVRGLYDEDGRRTDTYSYDAYGNLLTAEGETENDFLYTGEQYNANTGLYYLRARYMDPSTGTFISMDSYQGNLYDPVSLHKYLYANANPVMNTDPTGCFSIGEALTQFAGSATISGAEIRHNAMVIAIGLGILYKLRHVVAIENAVIRYHQAMAKILIDGKVFENIDQVVEYVNELVKEENKSEKQLYVVYTLEDDDEEVRYVGRTKDYETRMKQHKRPGGKIYEYNLNPGKIVLKNLTKEQARGLEQMLLVLYHTGNFLKDASIPYYNFINGVGIKNENKTAYYEAAKKYMKDYPSLFENFLEEERNAIREDMGAWW